MIKNYLKIALRIFWKNKAYVAINLAGLGFALACCILSYINYDYRAKFDKNHSQTEQIYRINSTRKVDGSSQPWGLVPVPIAEAMIKDIPGIARTARLFSKDLVVKNNQGVFAEKVFYADKNIFSFFNFPLSQGNYNEFDNNKTIVVSEAYAYKYFGKESAIGKEVTLVKDGREEAYTVRAVLKKMPLNSSFQFDIVTSFKNAFSADQAVNDWHNKEMITAFAELTNKGSAQSMKQLMSPYVRVHNQARQDWQVESFYLQPFHEVALTSDVDFTGFVYGRGMNPNPRGVLVIVPAIMSLFILLITCFNFTNISIAFASRRLKEIGIRKVMGVRKRQLIFQFLTENILLCLIASGLAIFIIYLLLPAFNSWSGVELQFNLGENIRLWAILILLPVAAAIVAGLYPSFYISSFEPVGILKGQTSFGPKSRFTRILLISQFSISCLALVVGIMLSKNAAYQDKVDFGYAINEVVVTEVDNEQQFDALVAVIEKDPRVSFIAGAEQQVGAGTYTANVDNEGNVTKVQVANIGAAYLRAMDIKLLAGRDFHSDGSIDKTQSIIINQTLAKNLHMDDPLGKRLKVDSSYYTLIGLTADYKERGLHGLVPPCILRMAAPADYKYFVARANQQNLMDVQKTIIAAWYKVVPDKPYNGFLQSDVVEKERYMNEGFKAVSFFLAAMTILLSISGLFALVSLNIIRRNKEVGMRKVLGASVLNIMGLITKEFMYMLITACIVGFALGYLIIDKLIFRVIYAYHTEIGPGAFLSAFLIIMISCFGTVGIKVYQAASSNPINVLRKN
ncbi:MAG: FtsX-like permease family protein [Chitinophagaceae bacterium]